MHASLVAVLLLALASMAGAEMAPMWKFDRGYAPAPDLFLLTVTQGGASPQQYRVALAAPGACLRIEGAEADSFCTTLDCPAPGSVVGYWVQAVWGSTLSAPSNLAMCWFSPADPPCVCRDPATASPALPPAPTPEAPPSWAPPLTTEIPPLVSTVPPLSQQSAEGLNLLPIGTLPPLPTIPAIPTTAGG